MWLFLAGFIPSFSIAQLVSFRFIFAFFRSVLFLKNGCRITSIVFLKCVLCLCVLGVCHKDLCVAIYTHTDRETDRQTHKAVDKTKSRVERLFDAYIEWKTPKVVFQPKVSRDSESRRKMAKREREVAKVLTV